MALQSNANLHLLIGPLTVSSFSWPLFPIFILHLLISVCIQFHPLFFGPHNILSLGLLLNIWLTFLLLSIVLMWPIWFIHYQNLQTTASVLFYHFLQFLFTLIPPNILLKTFLSTAASCLAISLFSVEDSAQYVATGLVHFYFFCSEYWLTV